MVNVVELTLCQNPILGLVKDKGVASLLNKLRWNFLANEVYIFILEEESVQQVNHNSLGAALNQLVDDIFSQDQLIF